MFLGERTVINSLPSVSAGCVAAALGTFLYYYQDLTEDDTPFDRGDIQYYDWAMYVNFASILFGIITSVLSGVLICKSPKSDHF